MTSIGGGFMVLHGAPLDKDGQRDSLWLDSLYKFEREASMAAEQAISTALATEDLVLSRC